MPDDFMTSEHMMKLPLPAIVVDKGAGWILYANEAAQRSGLQAGVQFVEASTETDFPPNGEERSVNITVTEERFGRR